MTEEAREKPSRHKLTKTLIDSLKVPQERVQYTYDQEVRGLRIGIHPGGRKTFGLIRKWHGEVVTIPLGEYPHVSITQARAEASKKIAAMARGEDPRDKNRLREEITFGQYFERYLKEHKRRGSLLPFTDQQRHALQLTFKRYLEPWRKRPLSAIMSREVETLIDEVRQPRDEVIRTKIGNKIIERGRQRGGPIAANRLLSLVASIFNDAHMKAKILKEVPTDGIDKTTEQPRRRLLDRGKEFQRFFKALSNEPDTDLRHYLTLRLFTGVRGRNILEARWADVNLDRKIWQIGKTKNGDPLLVTLSPFVVENVFNQRKRDGEWLFPGNGNGGRRRGLTKSWRRFRRRVGLADLQLRDLRRTFASRQAVRGVPMEEIAETLGHKPGSRITASVYALADEDRRRETVDATVKGMLEEANG